MQLLRQEYQPFAELSLPILFLMNFGVPGKLRYTMRKYFFEMLTGSSLFGDLKVFHSTKYLKAPR